MLGSYVKYKDNGIYFWSQVVTPVYNKEEYVLLEHRSKWDGSVLDIQQHMKKIPVIRLKNGLELQVEKVLDFSTTPMETSKVIYKAEIRLGRFSKATLYGTRENTLSKFVYYDVDLPYYEDICGPRGQAPECYCKGYVTQCQELQDLVITDNVYIVTKGYRGLLSSLDPSLRASLGL